jgi:hypothetical protein
VSLYSTDRAEDCAFSMLERCLHCVANPKKVVATLTKIFVWIAKYFHNLRVENIEIYFRENAGLAGRLRTVSIPPSFPPNSHPWCARVEIFEPGSDPPKYFRIRPGAVRQKRSRPSTGHNRQIPLTPNTK